NGSTLVCIPCVNTYLEALTREIFGKLKMRGLASIEYKKCEITGNFYIIEPTVGRCDHQSLVAEYCGVDLVLSLIDSTRNPESNPQLDLPIKSRVWVDEIAFLRLIKLSRKIAFNVASLIGLRNL